MDSLYSVNVPNKDYIDIINDIARMVTIQITIQFLFFINSPGEVAFFSVDFILMVLYMVLGICVYWLIIKKVVVFK